MAWRSTSSLNSACGVAKTGPILGSLVFFLIAPASIAGWVPYMLSRWRFRPPFFGIAAGRFLGALIVVIGAAALVECFARFATTGRGTPAPVAPPKELVASGFYRYVRNPMYVAVVAVIVGQALLFGNVVLLEYAAIVWLLFHLFVLAYEEPTLRRQFGPSYDVYRTHVRRWWPRLRPWSNGAD